MNFATNYYSGLRTAIDGYQFMKKNPKLWRYAALPTAINIILTLASFAALIWVGISINEYISESWTFTASADAGWLTKVWQSVVNFLIKTVAVIGVILTSLVSLVAVWFILQNLLCAYFYGILARQTELLLGMHPDQMKEISLLYQVTDAIRAAFALVVVTIGLMLFSFVPVIGAIVASVGTYYFDAYIFGYDYFDYAMEIRGMRRREKIRLLANNRMKTLGLGTTSLFFSFVPIIGAFFLSTSTVGAVLLFRTLEDMD